MKIQAYIDRNFWLALIVAHAAIGFSWLLYQVYEGASISPYLVFRALFPAVLWLSIWLGLRYWIRSYSGVDCVSRANCKPDH